MKLIKVPDSSFHHALSAIPGAEAATFSDAVQVFGEDTPMTRAARRMYQSDGETEVDEITVVSRGDDPGAYVMAWVWVANSDLRVRWRHKLHGRTWKWGKDKGVLRRPFKVSRLW